MTLSKKQIKIIKTINDFKELAKNHPEIVYLIKKNKIKEYYPDRYREKLGKSFWTKELVFKYGKLCRTREEFDKFFSFAYNMANKNGWMDSIMKDKLFWHDNIRKHSLQNIIEKCEKMNIMSYFDFRHKLPSEYQQAYQQGWSNPIKDYLKNKIKKSNEELERIANKIFIKEMKLGDKDLQLYFKMIPEDRGVVFNEIQKLKEDKKLQFKKLSQKKVSSIIKKKKNVTISYKDKIIDPKFNIRYSDEDILNVAKNFTNRKEFSLKARGAYEAAFRRKILDKVCSHMNKHPESLGEQLVRKAFNYHFNKIFYKIRPEWLVNPKTGLCLELDGFNDELNIAFEVNGGHHYNSIYQDVKIMEFKDDYKKKMCKKYGVKLYVFEYKKELESLIRDLNKEFKIPIDWLKNVALDLRGKLTHKEITKYRNMLKLSPDESVKQVSYEKFASYINILRKQNLDNNKILQVLKVTKAHLSHRILRINQLSIPLINR